MVRRLLLCILLACPSLAGADKTTDKTLSEVLRDLDGLQQQFKEFEKTLAGQIAAAGQNNAEQARAAADQTAKSIAALSDRMQKGLQDQQDQQGKTLAAVAANASQIQAVLIDLGTLREAANDLTAAMAKLTTQLTDLTAAVKDLQPKAAPPEVSATELFASAEGDRLGGKLDLSLQEYTAYMTKFGATAQAPDAQYYVGSIHYSNQEWDDAVKAFDLLIQTYPDNKTRMPAALFYKADAQAHLGQGPDAADTLKELRRRFPNDPLAKRSLTIKPLPHLQ